MQFQSYLFDLDDTLIDFKASESIGLQKCREAHFPLVERASFEKDFHAINRSLWQSAEQGDFPIGQIDQERFARLCRLYDREEDQKIAAYYGESLVQHSSWIEGARELLVALQECGAKIGYLTNGFSRIQKAKVEKLGLNRFSEVLVISEEVGMAKPKPEIFFHAL